MRFLSLALLGSSVLLAGCGSTPNEAFQDVHSAAMRGVIFGGQQPIAGSTVTVWQAGSAAYGSGAIALASTLSGTDGTFQFTPGAYTCSFDNAPVYITAQGGDPGSGVNADIVLATGLGTCLSAQSAEVEINEVTTAATAFALGQFFTTTMGGLPATDSFGGPGAGLGSFNTGLAMADSYTIPTLVDVPSGLVAANTATKNIESAKIYSIANTLAACVNSTGETSTTETTTACGKLFDYTKTPGGSTRPLDTLQAAVQMSRYPYQNVEALFELATAKAPFTGLGGVPNDWTIGVSYSSPELGLGIAGTVNSGGTPVSRTSSTLDIDAAGKIWFPSNAAGAHGVAYFDPTANDFHGPYSTGLVQPQYVAIDMDGLVWATDLSSSALTSNSTSAPTAAGSTIAVANSTGGGPLTIDLDNAVLFSYVTTGSPYPLGVETGGTVTPYNAFQFKPTGLVNERVDFGPSGAGDFPRNVYAITEQGGGGVCDLEQVYVAGGFPTDIASPSGIATCFTGGGAIATAGFDELFSITSANELFEAFSTEMFTPAVPLSGPEGIATDGQGNEWIANSGNASVSTLGYNGGTNGDSDDFITTSPIAYLHDGANGGTMTTPFGIGVDRSGNVWVSNASCVTVTATQCAPNGFTLTELIGAAAPTITPIAAQGINTGGLPPSVGVSPKAMQGRRRR